MPSEEFTLPKYADAKQRSDVTLWSHYQLDDPESFLGGHPRQDALFERIRSFGNFGRIIEIGFGDGYLLRRLADLYEVFGVDISPQSVQHAAEQLPSVTFSTLGSDGKLEYPDENFDVFVASEVFEHLNDRELERAVAEMHRVLKSGGHALLTFPAREKLKDNECFCPHCGSTFHKWGHKQEWNEAKLCEVFGNFFIERIEERYFMPPDLNLFGRLEGLARIALSKIRRMSNMTFLVTLRK